MQYHEVKLNFNFASTIDGIDTSANQDPKAVLYVDYVYLDSDERRRFAQSSHEYLIEQLQYTGEESATIDQSVKKTVNYRLNMNHPVKYLVWVVRGAKHGQYTGADSADVANIGTYKEALAPIASAKLQLNGHDRFSERKGSYFNNVVPFQTCKAKPAAGIYMYSFCLRPDELQPSGTCNMSRIDAAMLNITYKKANVVVSGSSVAGILEEDVTATACQNLTGLRVFASNYNVLRIMSGMGGLAYSN